MSEIFNPMRAEGKSRMKRMWRRRFISWAGASWLFLALSLAWAGDAATPTAGIKIHTRYEKIEPSILPEIPPQKLEGISHGTYQIVYHLEAAEMEAKISIYLNAVPGASLEAIRDELLANELLADHHDILIFEGGKNNALNGGTPEYLSDRYRAVIQTVKNRADALNVPLFIQEIDPIDPVILTQRGFNGPQYLTNIQILNSTLNTLASEANLRVIPIFDAFLPHYNATEDAWCRNQANSGNLDGSHPTAFGARQFGAAWWDAIAEMITQFNHRPVSVGIYGDSIAATTYLAEDQRPAAWFLYYSSLNAVGSWSDYL